MANLTLDALTHGSFSIAGTPGEDDYITLTIGLGFEGTISIESSNNDGWIVEASVIIPDGWTIELEGEMFDGFESPDWVQRHYTVKSADGLYKGNLLVRSNDIAPMCFASGTQIATPTGQRRIEELNVDDYISTVDGSNVAIRWIGKVYINAAQIRNNPKLRPVCISKNALGRGLPNRDLVVSRQHRLLVSNPITKRMFGDVQVLIAAHRLLMLPGIAEVHADVGIFYYHLLCDRHEVLFAEGAPAESLYLGDDAVKRLDFLGKCEVQCLFPQLFVGDKALHPSAFHIPKNQVQNNLCKRIEKNNHSVLG